MIEAALLKMGAIPRDGHLVGLTRRAIPLLDEQGAWRVEEVELPSRQPGERLTINAVLALHHTAERDRDRTLRRLAATGADALVICEPEADHDAPAFLARLDAALAHYGLLFLVFDRCLAANSAMRATIEGQIFGREIHNILVGEGPAGVERHAPAVDWERRLRAAGLRPMPFRCPPSPRLPYGVGVTGAAFALTVDGQPLVSVSAWGGAEACGCRLETPMTPV